MFFFFPARSQRRAGVRRLLQAARGAVRARQPASANRYAYCQRFMKTTPARRRADAQRFCSDVAESKRGAQRCLSYESVATGAAGELRAQEIVARCASAALREKYALR